MMTTEFDELVRITAVLQERALAKYRDILSEERQLRQELAEIEQLRRAAMTEDSSAHARRISGVDAQWQAWLVQRQTRINQQLALCQVRKAERQDAARLSFGRQDVASGLAAEAARTDKVARRGKDEESLRELALLRQVERDPRG